MRLHAYVTRAVLLSAMFYCVGGSALAATPQISGPYVVTFVAYCQPPSTAETTFSEGLATFDSSTGTYTQMGFSEKGSPPTETEDNLDFTYSNTATTVTIQLIGGSEAVTYHVTYGHVTNGIARYFALIAIDFNGCIRQSQWVHK